jgi:hypothetical protein
MVWVVVVVVVEVWWWKRGYTQARIERLTLTARFTV